MDQEPQSDTYFDPLFVRNMLESSLRIGLVFILLFWTYDIIRPFMVPILWGSIIAMAAYPLVTWLEPKLGGRRGLTCTVITLFFVLALVVPTWILTDSMLGGLKQLYTGIETGELKVSAPPKGVQEWPLIGEKTYALWSEASRDLDAAIAKRGEQIKEIISAVLKRMGSSLMGVLMFVVALVISGALMTFADPCAKAANRIFVRIGGLKPGGEWASMTVATVRNVLKGVIGVALIQTTLVGIGLFVAGIPGAPLWTAVVLFLAIAQLPPLIILAPIMGWMFSTGDTTAAVIFTVYQIIAGGSDSFLKPMLMGRGLDIPMPVILLGAIGGMIAMGIIGLFAGAVVLSIWYKLFQLWMEQEAA